MFIGAGSYRQRKCCNAEPERPKARKRAYVVEAQGMYV